MQRGFTKLFNTIVTSTIWQEDDKTRIVWITMLAIADAFGNVFAAIPGLASVANVSIESTEKAVANLLAPDPYSRTKDFEGRRIEEIDGGWHILNYGKYRKMMDEEERREYKAKWAREKRRQSKTNVDKDGHTATVRRPSGHRQRQSTEAEEQEIYRAYPLKVGKPDAIKAIRRALRQFSFDDLLSKTKSFSDARDGDVAFCPNPATWFNQMRFNDDPETWKPKCQNGQTTSNGRQRQMSAFEIEKRKNHITAEINTIFKRNGNQRIEGDGIDDLKQRRDELQKQLTL